MAAVNARQLMLRAASLVKKNSRLAPRRRRPLAPGAAVPHRSLIFSLTGGLLGLLVMRWGIAGLVAMAPADLPRINEVTVDPTVLFVTLLTAVIAGIIVGILPAFSSVTISPQAALQEHSRGSSSGGRKRARAILVVAEVALAVALTTSAGLLIRSFVRVMNVDPGFQSEHLLTWQMNIPAPDQSHDRLAFYRLLRASALRRLQVGGTTRIRSAAHRSRRGRDRRAADDPSQLGGRVRAPCATTSGDGHSVVKGRSSTRTMARRRRCRDPADHGRSYGPIRIRLASASRSDPTPTSRG